MVGPITPLAMLLDLGRRGVVVDRAPDADVSGNCPFKPGYTVE
jgi:hypothetical protein